MYHEESGGHCDCLLAVPEVKIMKELVEESWYCGGKE
jgi:hypothetical protein